MSRLRRTLASRVATASQARLIAAFLAVVVVASCVPKNKPALPPGAPRYPDYPAIDVPADLRVAPEIRQEHDLAWQHFQGGDSRSATREFNALLKRSPGFYPAAAALGYVSLADKQFKAAGAHFADALAMNDRYLPALLGQADAQLAMHNDEAAVPVLEQILKVDPSRQALRNRLDVLRLRIVQSQVEASRRDRDAGRLEDAQSGLERALAVAPDNAVLLRELAVVETARGSFDPAEAHARRSIQLDAGDPDALAALGAVLEAKERYRDAADAFAKANALDPRPAWRDRAESLKNKALAASIPPEYRSIPTAPTVTRAQVAAMIGLRLDEVISRAPKRVTAVATDVRNHWAAEWIVKVTQAGVMEVYPNHTFQPTATLRRSDLARIVSQLLALAATKRPEELARWKAARPKFSDVPPTHVAYAFVALAVTSGAMTADNDRFGLTLPATGADLVAAISRIDQIAGR